MRRIYRAINISLVSILCTTACSQNNKFGLASKEDQYSQKSDIIQTKLDVLWVIDNSGSMASSQAHLGQNFSSFIAKMKEKKFDFQIAVTTTDAWTSFFSNDPTASKFKQGVDPLTNEKHTILTPQTNNLEEVFKSMANQGIKGNYDERSLQSLMAALKNTDNKVNFPRKDAFLSVIILSDEDDFSNSTTASMQLEYTNPGLHTVSSYVDFMDWVKDATPENRSQKYTINTIAVLDEACRAQISTDGFTERIVAKRLIEASDTTNGFKGSICDDFSSILTNLADTILKNSTKFYLSTVPLVSTISVFVNDVEVPKDNLNGWSYDAVENAIIFNGSSVPGQNSSISIRFDRTAPGT